MAIGTRKQTTTALLIAMGIMAAADAAAAPTGSARAQDLSVELSLLGVTSLEVGSQATAEIVSATETTSDEQEIASLDLADALGLITLSTGVVSAQTEYVNNGMAAVAARAEVNDLDLGVIGLLGDDVLSLGAGLVASQVALAGYCPETSNGTTGLLDDFLFFNGFEEGNLGGGSGGGSGGGGSGGGAGGLPPSESTLIDVELGVIGIPVPALPLHPEPNTSVDLDALGIVGVSLVLNEQVREGDGVRSLSLTSNALHLTLNVAGLITGDVVIASSAASLTCP